MTEAQRQHRWRVILAFGLVYLFWGSTYLGIAIAVESIPPALMCGTRFLIAGTLMLIFLALRGRRILYSPEQLAKMAVVETRFSSVISNPVAVANSRISPGSFAR